VGRPGELVLVMDTLRGLSIAMGNLVRERWGADLPRRGRCRLRPLKTWGLEVSGQTYH
jgi:hypothetical protein